MKAIKTTIAQSGTALYIKALIFGTIAGCLCLTVLLCIGSAALLILGTLPHAYLSIISIMLCSVSTFISGFVSASITKQKGIVLGSSAALIIFVIVLLAGFIWGDGNFTYLTIIKLVLFLILGALGGIKAVNKKDRLHIK